MTQRSSGLDLIASSVTQIVDQLSAASSSRRLTVADVLDETQLSTFKARYRKRLSGFGIRHKTNLDAAMVAFDETAVITGAVKDQWVKALQSVGLDEMASTLESSPSTQVVNLDAAWLKEDGSTVFDPLAWASDARSAP